MFVGTPPTGDGSMDGFGTAARFRRPTGIAIDSAGLVYVADSLNFTIRRITPDGLVRTWAGTPGQAGFADGTASEARFGGPPAFNIGLGGVALDAAGNLWIADRGNHRIRKMTPQAAVTTLAGGNEGSQDGPAALASFSLPTSIAVDPFGNAYVSESLKGWIRKLGAGGVVTTVAGAAEMGAGDGPGPLARFGYIAGLAADASGNVYVADNGNRTIRRIGLDGTVSTIAGQTGVAGSADGMGAQASFTTLWALAIAPDGALYVSDQRRIRRVRPSGEVTTIAVVDVDIGALAVSASGDIHATGLDESIVLRITPQGAATVIAGSRHASQAPVDGNAAVARFAGMTAMTLTPQGDLVVIDNDSIRKVALDGQVSTLASGIPNFGLVGLVADEAGAVYFATFTYCGLRPNPGCLQHGNLKRLDSGGQVSDLVPSASTDGTPLTFQRIGGLTRDATGNLYITDEESHRILKLDGAGKLTTVSTSLRNPTSIAVDRAGSLFAWDFGTRTVYRIDHAVTAFFTPLQGNFQRAPGISVDDAGNVYVADPTRHTVTKVSPSGVVLEVTGQPGRQGFEAGLLPGFLDTPQAAAARGSDLFIAMPTGIAVVRNRP